MEAVVFEDLEHGEANAFFKGIHWRRKIKDGEYGPVSRWVCLSSDSDDSPLSSAKFNTLLEEYYQLDDHRKIQRFPRRGVSREFADLLAIPRIGEVESEKSQWLVEGLILEGSINLLTAPPGGFKTWLALALGGAVSRGVKFLGRKTVKTPVLYLDRENPPSVIRKRRKMLRLDDDFFHVWGHWWEHEPPSIGDPRLIEIAERHHPLIIFDPLVRFHSADENNAKQMAKISRRLRRLADAGAAILILHHQAKSQGSQYRGSTDILAGVDAAFELHREKPKDEIILSLSCFKHRLLPEMAITIRLNLQKGRFEVLDDPSSEISPAVIERIKSAILQHPRITQRHLLQKAELPETNGRRILQQGDGVHWLSKRGKGTTLHYVVKG